MIISNKGVDLSNNVDTIVSKYTQADIQKGYYKAPSFFGDHSSTTSHQNFQSGLNSALAFSSFAINLGLSLVEKRTGDEKQFVLTIAENNEIIKKAQSIYKFGNVPYENILDFLYILVAIDNIEDMKKISIAIGIDELNNVNILNDVYSILAINELEKIAFMASAIASLIKTYSKYNSASSLSGSGNNDLASLLSNLSSFLGGFGSSFSQLLDNNSATDALGHFMSEVITGKRIPTNIIAKNPNLQSPSYAGKSFFGESPGSIPLTDITQIFNKKVAVFGEATGGAGTTSFGFQNFSSLSSSQTVETAISRILFNTPNVSTGSYARTMLDTVLDKIDNDIGAKKEDSIELNRSDNGIPIMLSLSSYHSGSNTSLYSDMVFKDAWVLSNSVMNELNKTNPLWLKGVRALT